MDIFNSRKQFETALVSMTEKKKSHFLRDLFPYFHLTGYISLSKCGRKTLKLPAIGNGATLQKFSIHDLNYRGHDTSHQFLSLSQVYS